MPGRKRTVRSGKLRQRRRKRMPLDRLSDDKGQTAIEYVLIIALVILSLALVIRSEFSNTVEIAADKIETKIEAELTLP